MTTETILSFRSLHLFLLQDFHPGSRTYIYCTCNRPLEFLIMTVCLKREMTEYSLILLFIDHISCNMIFFWVKAFMNCFHLSNFRNIYVFLQKLHFVDCRIVLLWVCKCNKNLNFVTVFFSLDPKKACAANLQQFRLHVWSQQKWLNIHSFLKAT